jgi:predicted RNA-binding protein YlxR (DUF448 family)
MMTKDKPCPRPKHIPQRTCIACRKTAAKRELVRLVCLDQGGVDIDTTGKKSGRGAYLCPSRTCWEGALNAGRLEYALHISLKPDNKEELVNYAKGFDNTIS